MIASASRNLLAAALLVGVSAAATAAGPALRGDVTVARDMLTLGDLVSDVPAALAETPIFRAPMLGQTGTIQARRILSAVEALGLPAFETGGRAQVTVTRAARVVAAAEIEAALRRTLVRQHGLDPSTTGIRFEGALPSLVAEQGTPGELQIADAVFDPRSRRVTASVFLGPSAAERLSQARIVGTVIELVEVALLGRALDRGEVVKASDIAVERRPRESVPTDAAYDGAPLEGRVARRALGAGSFLRGNDLIRPEIVARGDVVTVVYQMPGMSLAMRAKATEGGALGDTVGLVNPTTKKTIQGVVIGAGRVSVSASSASVGRVAAAQ